MSRTLTLSIVSVGLLLSGTAFAQALQPAGGPGRDAARPETRDAVQQRAAQMFARLDANSDGKIDTTDRAARSTERTTDRFAQLDSNGDGAISAEEFAAPREMRRSRMAQGDAAANRGGRMGKGMGQGMGRGGNARTVLGQADTDNDGAVSQDEFSAALLARFDSADANSDGSISREERRAARPEGRRGGRDGRQGDRLHGQPGSSG